MKMGIHKNSPQVIPAKLVPYLIRERESITNAYQLAISFQYSIWGLYPVLEAVKIDPPPPVKKRTPALKD
jgi:hypothetical protein